MKRVQRRSLHLFEAFIMTNNMSQYQLMDQSQVWYIVRCSSGKVTSTMSHKDTIRSEEGGTSLYKTNAFKSMHQPLHRISERIINMTWMEGTQTNEETWMTEDPIQLLVSECSIALCLLFLKEINC